MRKEPKHHLSPKKRPVSSPTVRTHDGTKWRAIPRHLNRGVGSHNVHPCRPNPELELAPEEHKAKGEDPERPARWGPNRKERFTYGALVLAQTTMAGDAFSQTKPSKTPRGPKKHDLLENAGCLGAHSSDVSGPLHLGLWQQLPWREAQWGVTNTPPLTIVAEHAMAHGHKSP